MVTLEELNAKIIQLKAQEHSLKEAIEVTHNELMFAIGRLDGYKQGHADGVIFAKKIQE